MRNRSKGWLWTREVVTLPARNHESSADLEWQWTLRADGSVWWRLTRVRGREEHNDWQCAGQLDKAAWNALAAGQLTPADYLETCARDHGHRLAAPRHRQARLGKCPACGALAARGAGRHAAAAPAAVAGLAGPVRALRRAAPQAAVSRAR